MTRLDIADYLGLTIETVSRTITRLAKKGIIATEGRQGIRIENLDALVQRAGDGEEWAIRTRRHAQAAARPN
jgi:CRP/FNR family transcriptional regulator